MEQHTSTILTSRTISYMKRVALPSTPEIGSRRSPGFSEIYKMLCWMEHAVSSFHLERGEIEVPRKCELCGKAIPAERVKALPETKRCVECAEKKGSDIVAKRTDIGMDIDTYKDLLGAIRS